MEVTIQEIIMDLFTVNNLLAMMAGVLGGIIIGALPGLTANMGVALLIPITFGMDPVAGLLMLMAVYTSAIYGGSISAILLHTPGTSASAATAIDGYELTMQGKSGLAIRIATVSSVIGGFISGIFLLTLTPPLSLISLKFGPPEYFLVAIFGLTTIGSISTGSINKGLISGALGLLISTVGMELNSGFPRFTFGLVDLQSGVSFVPAMIGLFSLSQVMFMVEKTHKESGIVTNAISDWRYLPRWNELKSIKTTILRSSLIGVLVGILPGAGGDIASWVSYNEAKRFSKKPELFGKGAVEGVAASEAANNAVTGGSLIPLLTLGIPGSATAAVLLGGLMIQGLVPGRELFTRYGEITYTVILGFILANVVMGVVGMLAARFMSNITMVSNKILAPLVVILCIVGSFALGNNFFDVWVMIIFGLLGYIMRKTGFHPAPVVLGLILGPMTEKGFRQSLSLSNGDLFSYFFTRPLSIVLIVLIVFALAWPIFFHKKKA
ncbi:MAG: tripartite tricarboxylate transporter permease [Dehalobacterium sp.]